MFTIGADNGKYAGKAVTRIDNNLVKCYCRNKIEETHSDEIINGDTYLVEYKDVKYLIGEEATKSDYDTSKSIINHKLLMYLMIAKLIGTRYEDIKIITGCPLMTFANIEEKEKYREFLKDNHLIDIKINNIRHKFNIIDVKVVPESIGYVYQDPNTNINKLLPVIDIGGLNANGAIYEKLKPIKSTIFTINEGGNIILEKIKKELRSKTQNNYQDYEIPYLLKNDYYGNKKIISESINYILKQHLDCILEEAKKSNWNLKGLPIVFTGGGSLLLEPIIRDTIPNAIISKDAVWDNAKAFYKIGGIINAKDG